MAKDLRAIFPIIDQTLREASTVAASQGEPIRCGAGCAECCYLLPEISWEEAEILASWLEEQPKPFRLKLERRIRDRAELMRRLAASRPSWNVFGRPTRSLREVPDSLCDAYFLASKECPFLIDGRCSAYEARPTVCRLHLVSSDPERCSRKTGVDGEVDTPAVVERAQKKLLRRIERFVKDGRRGQLAVMVEAVLKSRKEKRSPLAKLAELVRSVTPVRA